MKKTLIAMKMYCFHIQNFQVLLLKVTCYKSNGSQMTAFGDLDKKRVWGCTNSTKEGVFGNGV